MINFSVYEPSDDTFLLCDALELEKVNITQRNFVFGVEIGYDSNIICHI